MKTFHILIIFPFIVFSGLVFATPSGEFKPNSEPNGFRGIKWGTDISKLPGMLPATRRESRLLTIKGGKQYMREKENLFLGSIELTRIGYHTWHDKFYQVSLFTEGPKNVSALKNFIKTKYGDVTITKLYSPKTCYRQCITGENTRMCVFYSSSGGKSGIARCRLIIRSTKIARKILESHHKESPERKKFGSE